MQPNFHPSLCGLPNFCAFGPSIKRRLTMTRSAIAAGTFDMFSREHIKLAKHGVSFYRPFPSLPAIASTQARTFLLRS